MWQPQENAVLCQSPRKTKVTKIKRTRIQRERQKFHSSRYRATRKVRDDLREQCANLPLAWPEVYATRRRTSPVSVSLRRERTVLSTQGSYKPASVAVTLMLPAVRAVVDIPGFSRARVRAARDIDGIMARVKSRGLRRWVGSRNSRPVHAASPNPQQDFDPPDGRNQSEVPTREASKQQMRESFLPPYALDGRYLSITSPITSRIRRVAHGFIGDSNFSG